MSSVVTQNPRVGDVIKWLAHDSYNKSIVSLSNGSNAFSKGQSLIGMVAFNSSGWKILDSGDVITGTSPLAIIIHQRPLLADVIADQAAIITNCVIVEYGPAVVSKKGIVLGGGVVAATVYSALENMRIRLVDELGGAYAL